MPTPDDNFLDILTERVLPWWENQGMARRLMISKPTLKQFNQQRLPDGVWTQAHKRRGKKVKLGGPKPFNTTDYTLESWPEDGQEVVRYPSLVCVLRGQALFPIGDYVVHCRQGHLMLFSPLVPQPDGRHPHLHQEKGYCELLWLMPAPESSQQMLAWTCYSKDSTHWANTLFNASAVGCPALVQLFNFFIQQALEQSDGYEPIAQASFAAFLHLFVQQIKLGNFKLTTPATLADAAHNNGKASPIQLALEYIDSHLHQHLTTQSVAEKVFMSRTNFVRRFQKETNQSFNQYLVRQRIATAARLLADEQLSIRNISRNVGLSTAQLRTVFHQHYGQSPSAYRAAQRKNESN